MDAGRLNAQHVATMSRKRAVLAEGHDDRQTMDCGGRGEGKLMRRGWPIAIRCQRSRLDLVDNEAVDGVQRVER